MNAAQLTATWTADTTNVDGFSVERAQDAAHTYSEVSRVGGTMTSFADADVTAGTTYCYRVRAFNAAGYSGYSPEACAMSVAQVSLAVVRNDTTGTVTSSPSGITCGTACSALYPSGTAVSLTATAAAGATFDGWSGGGCTGTGTCTVTLTAPTTVNATFVASPAPTTTTLRIGTAGQGRGSIAATPHGEVCRSSSCTIAYASGTVVNLTATPANNSVFAGWSGGCTGTGACTVTVVAGASVTATFRKR